MGAEKTVGKYFKVSPHSRPQVLIVDLDVPVPVSPILLVTEAQDVHQLMLDDPSRTKYSQGLISENAKYQQNPQKIFAAK